MWCVPVVVSSSYGLTTDAAYRVPYRPVEYVILHHGATIAFIRVLLIPIQNCPSDFP
jgi:hypothetical protein